MVDTAGDALEGRALRRRHLGRDGCATVAIAMYVDRVEIRFEAGHRLLDYAGKCAAPHGHSFTAEVLVARDQLDSLGLVLDFGDIKGPLKTWVDEHWDHGFLVNDCDTTLIAALRTIRESKIYLFHGVNPSTEAMARELFEVARQQLGDVVRSVRVWESNTQYAEYAPGSVTQARPHARAHETLR